MTRRRHKPHRGPYWLRRVDASDDPALKGLAHTQLGRQRGLPGSKLGPANEGRRLSVVERQEIERRMKQEGKL